MIGKLTGLVDDYGDDHVIIDVGDVGYVVFCSSHTLTGLPQKGERASLWIETHVREDMIRLFGFASLAEREWFRLALTVQGVGAKVGLALLSTLRPSELASAVALQDKAAIGRTPGVGPKLAQRIVAELKGKAPALVGIDPLAARLAGPADEAAMPSAVMDAVSALVNLGYGQPQAAAAVAAAMKTAGEGAHAALLIKLGLRELAR